VVEGEVARDLTDDISVLTLESHWEELAVIEKIRRAESHSKSHLDPPSS